MNQSILFNDDAQWLEAEQTIMFTAQQMGMAIECHVSLNKIAAWLNLPITDIGDKLAAFEQCRFDIEDIAERLITQEAFNPQGQIIIR